MSEVEARRESGKPADRPVVVPAKPVYRPMRARRFRIVPFLITLVTTAVAAAFGWALWKTYMETPWTRDGTVRVYVVTKAPEVAGRIVELPVVDNQFVHKGDLLLVIDPTDYKVAVKLSEAAVHQAQADTENFGAQITVQQAQVGASQAQVESAQAALTFAQQQSRTVPRFGREGGRNRTDGAANGLGPGPGASGTQEFTGHPHARSTPSRIA
jgi:multidrug resistance efflux pump